MTGIRFAFMLFFSTLVCGLASRQVDAADATIDHICYRVLLYRDPSLASYLYMQCENCDPDTVITMYVDGEFWRGEWIDESTAYHPPPEVGFHLIDRVKLTYQGWSPSRREAGPVDGTVTVKNNNQTPYEKVADEYYVINPYRGICGCCCVCPTSRCRCGWRCGGRRCEPVRRRCRRWRCR